MKYIIITFPQNKQDIENYFLHMHCLGYFDNLLPYFHCFHIERRERERERERERDLHSLPHLDRVKPEDHTIMLQLLSYFPNSPCGHLPTLSCPLPSLSYPSFHSTHSHFSNTSSSSSPTSPSTCI